MGVVRMLFFTTQRKFVVKLLIYYVYDVFSGESSFDLFTAQYLLVSHFFKTVDDVMDHIRSN